MGSHQALKDDQLIAELYSGMAGDSSGLILEMKLTKANIERFIKKYKLDTADEFTGAKNSPEIQQRMATYYINTWTPELQQRIKTTGGNADIFAYPDKHSLDVAIGNATEHVSHSQQKNEVKLSDPEKYMPVVFTCDDYNMYRPSSWEASRKYFGFPKRISLLDGQVKDGAPWCTTASRKGDGPKHFNKYLQTSRLFYFIRKSDDALFAARCVSGNPVRWHEFTVTCEKSIRKAVQAYGIRMDDTTSKGFGLDFLMTEIKPDSDLVLECRDQKNKFIRISELYQELRPNNLLDPEDQQAARKYLCDYIKFVAYTVFGQNYEIQM